MVAIVVVPHWQTELASATQREPLGKNHAACLDHRHSSEFSQAGGNCQLYAQLRDSYADAVLLTGDVAEARTVVAALTDLDAALRGPSILFSAITIFTTARSVACARRSAIFAASAPICII